MKLTEKTALEVIDTIKNSKYMTNINLKSSFVPHLRPIVSATDWRREETYIVFLYNLAGQKSEDITKKLVEDLLLELQTIYKGLLDVSEAFRNFVGERKLYGEVWVFSGHYDIFLGEIYKGEITYHHNLEK